MSRNIFFGLMFVCACLSLFKVGELEPVFACFYLLLAFAFMFAAVLGAEDRPDV